MTATYALSSKPMTFAEFLEWKPNRRYELHNGVSVEMQPTGKHDEISGFLAIELALEIRRCNLPYFLGRDTLIKAPEGDTAYAPDGVVLDRTALAREPLWQKSSTLIHGTAIPLVIEITSNNWRDDYWHETLGIAEYWIVDYQALGGRRYIGEPKSPHSRFFNWLMRNIKRNYSRFDLECNTNLCNNYERLHQWWCQGERTSSIFLMR